MASQVTYLSLMHLKLENTLFTDYFQTEANKKFVRHDIIH